MTTKAARGKLLEADIEKSREESNWKRVIELADQLKTRHAPGFGNKIIFIQLFILLSVYSVSTLLRF